MRGNARFKQLRKRTKMARKPRITIDWSQWDDLLGKETDKVIAEKIGSSVAAVSMRRKKLGIDASGERGARIDWTEWDDLLGTMDDKSLADKMGCSIGSVVVRRNKKDVPAFNQRSKVDWEMWDEFIPDMSDSQLAKKIVCAPGSVKVRREKLGIEKFAGDLRKKVDWKKWEPKIGVVKDADLALMIGCTVGAIQAYKKKTGIENRTERERAQKTVGGIEWWRWDHLLGKCPDDVLAELMGVTRSKVGVRRMRLVVANYPLDWEEGSLPCLGGCGKPISSPAKTCGADECEARWKDIK